MVPTGSALCHAGFQASWNDTRVQGEGRECMETQVTVVSHINPPIETPPTLGAGGTLKKEGGRKPSLLWEPTQQPCWQNVSRVGIIYSLQQKSNSDILICKIIDRRRNEP